MVSIDTEVIGGGTINRDNRNKKRLYGGGDSLAADVQSVVTSTDATANTNALLEIITSNYNPTTIEEDIQKERENIFSRMVAVPVQRGGAASDLLDSTKNLETDNEHKTDYHGID